MLIPSDNNIAVLIVAAGASTRLGRSKQLLPYKKDTLLNYSIEQCYNSLCQSVYVVLGSDYGAIKSSVDTMKCTILHHENWQNGMSTSISFGINTIQNSGCNGAIVVMSDQPFLSTSLIDKICHKVAHNNTSIIASKYENGQGPPVYFPKHLFEEICALTGDDGAKSIIRRHQSLVSFVPFEKGCIDIDTEEDLVWLKD